MPTEVQVQHIGPMTRIRFETPSGIHILSAETRQALSEAVDRISSKDDCRVVVFEASGRTFLAGADLQELQGLHQDSAVWFAQAGQKLMNQVARLRPLTVCAIHAACVGGGCELALACDFRLASSTARIGLPETSLGIVPGWGGTVRSTSLLGPMTAQRMILSAELFPATEAQRLGLVDEVYTDEEFTSKVNEFVSRMLTRGPDAVQRAKKLIRRLSNPGLKKALRREAREFAACYASLEPIEGIAAFREKRQPVWADPSVATSRLPADVSGNETDSVMVADTDTAGDAPANSDAKRKPRHKRKHLGTDDE